MKTWAKWTIGIVVVIIVLGAIGSMLDTETEEDSKSKLKMADDSEEKSLTGNVLTGNVIRETEDNSIDEQIPEKTEEVETTNTRQVATIGEIFGSATNWDADSEIDGIEFSLWPENAQGDPIKVEGTIKAKIWKLECTEWSDYIDMCMEDACTKKDKDLIAERSINLEKEDYDWMGATIRVEYNKAFSPTGDLLEDQGCMDVILITSDGKRFESFTDTLFLS